MILQKSLENADLLL